MEKPTSDYNFSDLTLPEVPKDFLHKRPASPDPTPVYTERPKPTPIIETDIVVPLTGPVYEVFEIFYSVAGEGVWLGVPMVFVRLMKCNRACEFCDTPRSGEPMLLGAEMILTQIQRLTKDCKRVCLTGGEPFLYDLDPIVRLLIEKGYTVHFETNGDNLPEQWPWFKEDTWLAVSPKVALPRWPHYIREIKWLVGDGLELWRLPLESHTVKASAEHHFLQPVWNYKKAIWDINMRAAVELAKQYPDLFRLGLQAHKYLGVR